MNKAGPRVDFNRTGGLFRKTPGRTGTRGFRPLDLDLTVLVGLIQDLVQAVAYGSGGQERLGARAAALGRRSSAPAAALRRRRPNSAFPGRIRAGLGSGSTYTARVKHLGIQLGSGRPVEVHSMDGRKLHGGHRRRAAFVLCWVQIWAPKGASAQAKLT